MPGACPARGARLPSYLSREARELPYRCPAWVNLAGTDDSQGRLDFLSPRLAGFLPAPSSPTQSADTHLQSLKEHSAPTERPRVPSIVPCFLFFGFLPRLCLFLNLWALGFGSEPATFSVPLPLAQALQIFAKTPPHYTDLTPTHLRVQPPSEFYTLATVTPHSQTDV